MSFPRRQTTPFPRAWSHPRPTGTLFLVCVLAGWGAAQALLWWVNVPAMNEGMALYSRGLEDGEYWRFGTFQLLHANFLHFVGTISVLYFAGREVEPIVGWWHVMAMCLLANLAGGAASMALQPMDVVYGASAAAMAVLAAYATVLPEIEHRVRLFGLPIQFQTRHAVMLLMAAAMCCVKWKWAGEIGPAGMVTGAAIGWVWARALGFGRLFWFQRAAGERAAIERRHERMSVDEFITMEVDPILEKIASDGLRSLTRAERRVLERAKEKIEEKSG